MTTKAEAFIERMRALRARRILENPEDRPFLGIPDSWYEGKLFRCENDHVSRTVLKSEGLGRDACLACMGVVMITFPTDQDGPFEA